MIDEVHGLLDRYAQWVRDKSVLREVDDQYVEITTPYLDRHNDYAQIYVRRDNGAFLLTDGGDTIQDLRASGCDLETAKRRELLTAALNGFGVRREGDALQVRATAQEFPLRKHNLVQAMLAVNDLFYLSVPVVTSLFLEDVTAWLELHDIRFTLAFSWVDTREVRPAQSRFYAFLNDEHRVPTPAIADALRNYDIVPVVWSARESLRQELVA